MAGKVNNNQKYIYIYIYPRLYIETTHDHIFDSCDLAYK